MKKIIALMALLGSIVLSEKQTLIKKTEDRNNTYDLYNADNLEWQVFFTAFYNNKSGKSKSNSEIKDMALSEVKTFELLPRIRKRFITFNDKNLDLAIPLIPKIPDISITEKPININVPNLTDLPDIAIQGITSIQISDINVDRDINIVLLNQEIVPKTFERIVIPALNLEQNGNGYNAGSSAQNLYTNIDDFAQGTFLSSTDTHTALLQLIGTKGSTYTNTTGGSGSLTYVITSDIGTKRPGSRIIAMESHRGEAGSLAGNVNQVISLTTTGNLTVNTNNAKALEIEHGYSGRGDISYVNQGNIISDPTSYNVIGIDFIRSRNLLHAENWGSITLMGDTSIGFEVLNATATIGIVNKSNAKINLYGNGSYGFYLNNGDFSNTVVQTATNIDPSIIFTNKFIQNGEINLYGSDDYGVVVNGLAKFPDNTVLNGGEITISGNNSTGIYQSIANKPFINEGSIIISGTNNNGIRVDNGTSINSNTGIIDLNGNVFNSTGMVAANIDGPSAVTNNGIIRINSTNSKNIGMYGVDGGLTSNTVKNTGQVILNLTDISAQNIGIVNINSKFQNDGSIELNSTALNSTDSFSNMAVYSKAGIVNLGINSSIKLNTNGNDIGIYVKNNSILNTGGNISIESVSTDDKYDYGIYLDSAASNTLNLLNTIFTLKGQSVGIYSGWDSINFSSGNIINLSGEKGIGILYEVTDNSPVSSIAPIVNNAGIINSDQGIGIYILDNGNTGLKKLENNNKINIMDGGFGIVLNSSIYNIADNLEIVNNGIIDNTDNSVNRSFGIYSKNENLKVSGTGSIKVSSVSKNIGLYVNQGEAEFNSNIELGEGGIGVYLNGSADNTVKTTLRIGTTGNEITQLSGTKSLGLVSIGEKADIIIGINGISLLGFNSLNSGVSFLQSSGSNSGSLGVYIKNSNMDNSAGGIIRVGDYGAAVYLNSADVLRTIKLGKLESGINSIGLYTENSSYIDSIDSITTGENSVGIYVKSGLFDNASVDESRFYLGAGSKGYFLENGSLESSLGPKNMVFGDDISGVLMTGDSNIDSSIKNIKIGDKTLSNTQPIVLSIQNLIGAKSLSASLYGGDGAVGIYYVDTLSSGKMTYNGSGLATPDIEIGKFGGIYPAVGIYAKSLNNDNILDLNNTYLKVNGDEAIAVRADGAAININNGTIEMTGKGVVFAIQNNGIINVSPTTEIITPDNGMVILRVEDSAYINNSGTKIVVPNSSIGIFARNSAIINDGEIESKIFSGTKAVQSTGIYTEKFGVVINRNKINLGDEGIGIFGYYSNIINDVTGIINSGDFGVGEYVTLGSVVENNGKILVGNQGVGIYADNISGAAGVLGIGKENKIKNTGIIGSTADKAVGVYSIGYDPNNRSMIDNTGNINLSGYGTFGIFGKRTDISNSGNITVGSGITGINYSLGIFGTDSLVTLNGGNISTGDNSIGIGAVADTEDSEVRIISGNIQIGANSVYNYIKRETSSVAGISLTDTSGGIYDLNKMNQFGIYTSEGDVFSNKTIYIREGTGSIGIYGKNLTLDDMTISGITLNIENKQTGSVLKADFNSLKQITFNNKVNVLGNKATGIIQEDGRILNLGETTVSGEKSIGILAVDADGTVTGQMENFGNVNAAGKSSVGIYGTTDGTGQLEINNSGMISVSNSSVGIYGEKNSVINNTGNLFVGKDSVGIYGNQILVNQINGITDIEENGIGFYGKGGQIQLNNSVVNASGDNSAAFYGTDGATITAAGIINVGNNTSSVGSFGYVGRNGSTLVNNADINVSMSSVGMYAYNSTIINGNKISNSGTANNSDNSIIGMYGDNNSVIINTGIISTGDVSLGIYAGESRADNQGIIRAGNTYTDPNNSTVNNFAAGMYGYNNLNMINSGTIETGVKGIGIYSYKPMDKIENNGIISSGGEQTVGVFIETGLGNEFINRGSIVLTGNNSVGIAGVNNVKITNDSAGIINLTGENSVGIYADENTAIENKGLITVTGKNGIGILMKNGSTLVNSGIINADLSNGGQLIVTDPSVLAPIDYLNSGSKYDLPSIINAGVIKVNEKFLVPENAVIQIKVDPSTVRAANPLPSDYALEDINGKFLVSDAVKFIAPEFVLRNVEVTPDFSQGTNANVYKLEEVFKPTTQNGGLNSGGSDIVSKGIFWNAIPNVNSDGNLDIWMERILYSDIAKGSWWESFAKNLDENYEDAQGESLLFYDKLDMIENISELNKIIGNIAGNVYANINQREYDIAKTFDESLDLLQSSKNNTDESVKINIIAGKGATGENTAGVVGYDYTTTGVLVLKETEKSYKHKIGYSLGYLHTGFEFDDNNESEEWVDTIQIGGHNRYEADNWILRNDLTGRISFHNIDRNIDWGKSQRSEMNGTFETYSFTLDNIAGREIALGKDKWITPYGAFRLMYITRPGFEEEGKEGLEIEGNDAWSIKPRVGVELKAETPLGKKEQWKLSGKLDLAYEYELGDTNVTEKAKLSAVKMQYYDLPKPEEEGGVFRTRASVGVEVKDRYGIFLTGEYGAGDNSQDEYRTSIILKAVF